MNLQLLLCDTEVELDKNFVFPFNRTFEDLSNPTKIVVDYTKAVNIPMTAYNNRILGLAYRLDRVIGDYGTQNLSIRLDPAKKIPMKLVYNGDVLLDGYAKFLSANDKSEGGYYTLNLYGIIGLVFQKMMGIVVNEDQLTDEQKAEEDGGKKYVIEDYCTGAKLDKQFIKDCWDRQDHALGNPKYEQFYDYDIIGFAPGYRGFYGDFDSNKIQVADDKMVSLGEYVTELWKTSLIAKYMNQGKTQEEATKIAEDKLVSLKPDELVKDGMKDYQMREYRSYNLKPYVYFEKLWYMFLNKCEDLTGYKVSMDPTWFTSTNPYWANLCYMFDYMENKGTEQSTEINIFDKASTACNWEETDDRKLYSVEFETDQLSAESIKGSNNVVLKPFEITIHSNYQDVKPYKNWLAYVLNPEVCSNFTITIQDKLPDGTFVPVSTHRFWNTSDPAGSRVYNPNPDFKDAPFIQRSQSNDPAIPGLYGHQEIRPDHTFDRWDTFKFPSIVVNPDYTFKGQIYMTVNCQMLQKSGIYEWGIYLRRYRYDGGTDAEAVRPVLNNIDKFSMTVPSMRINSSYNTNTTVSLRSIYFKEDPLFKIILQYTKMFGLIWKADYQTKTISILTRNTYFKKYQVRDWNNLIDRKKDFIVEPIAFPDKFVKFNYEDTDGFRYSGYKDKYGVQYGEKVISTNYDFNTDERKLFEGISPSSASSKTYLVMQDLIDWQENDKLFTKKDDKTLLDAEDESEESSISIYNWYFRGYNDHLDYNIDITDDTPLMIQEGESCYLDQTYSFMHNLSIRTNVFPHFDIAYLDQNGVYGCLFTAPKEDYTSSKLPTKALHYYIFERYWKNYLDERYNIQNKKVTCYVYLSPAEYQEFDFNQFVTIGQQLFVVNRIMDYDITNNNPTKVELIQVTHPSVYRESMIN